MPVWYSRRINDGFVGRFWTEYWILFCHDNYCYRCHHDTAGGSTPRLTVPHYDMKNRGFMLWPLFEIAPELRFPDGLALRDVLATLGAEKPASW